MEPIFPPPANDHLVSQLVKRLSQAPTDPRRAASNKNGVIVHLHLLTSTGWTSGPELLPHGDAYGELPEGGANTRAQISCC